MIVEPDVDAKLLVVVTPYEVSLLYDDSVLATTINAELAELAETTHATTKRRTRTSAAV